MLSLLDNPVFKVYAISALLLTIKMMFAQFNVTRLRFRFGIFKYEEDYLGKTKKGDVEKRENFEKNKQNIDRAYGLHVNDMENVYQFYLVGLIYVLTNPSLLQAQILLYSYTAFRYIHHVSYLFALQPWRALSFTANGIITVVMISISLFSIFTK